MKQQLTERELEELEKIKIDFIVEWFHVGNHGATVSKILRRAYLLGKTWHDRQRFMEVKDE